jgi:hypothetical protein
MNAISIEAAFRDWWEESYKRPPSASGGDDARRLYRAHAAVG